MKKIFALVIVLSLALSLCSFSGFAADNGEFTITTGAEYVEKVVSANFGSTFIIEGAEDTDGDGEADGIILPDEYTSITGFYGTIIGVDGKNNIQLATTPGNEKPLIATVKSGRVTISNITLKGASKDGTGSITRADHAAALVCQADNSAVSSVTISDVTNYVDVEGTETGKGVGAILGYSRYDLDITISNCVNYGSLKSRTNAVGSMIGYVRDPGTIKITKCINYGNINALSRGNKSYAGGICSTFER